MTITWPENGPPSLAAPSCDATLTTGDQVLQGKNYFWRRKTWKTMIKKNKRPFFCVYKAQVDKRSMGRGWMFPQALSQLLERGKQMYAWMSLESELRKDPSGSKNAMRRFVQHCLPRCYLRSTSFFSWGSQLFGPCCLITLGWAEPNAITNQAMPSNENATYPSPAR